MRRRKEELLFENKNLCENSTQLREIICQHSFWLKLNEIGFQIISQVSVWCLLQIMCAISA